LHRSKQIWKRNEDWQWKQRFDLLPADEVSAQIDKYRLSKIGGCDFQITKNKRTRYQDNRYILIGKGYYPETINN
jgi:hypothetical protein